MWVVKAKGQSYYVSHVVSNAPFSTKETPENEHTKGSLKFKNVSIVLENGVITISPIEGGD